MVLPPDNSQRDAETIALLQQAMSLHQQRRLAEAEQFYRQILAKAPGQCEALQLLGAARVQQGSFAEGAELIARALGINPRSAPALLNLGHALAGLGRHEEALRRFDQALSLKPDYPQARQGRGLSLFKLGCFEAALESFELVIAVHPRHIDALVYRGLALEKLGRHDEAAASYGKALELSPGDAHILNCRGNVFLRLHRHQDALRDFEAVLARAPDLIEALSNRGAALNGMNRHAEAVASYDRAIALDPSLAELHYNRGNALQKLDRLDSAIASFSRAISLRPDYIDALHNRGNALSMQGHFAAAIADYHKVLDIDPGHPFTLAQCAFCHLSVNDWERFEGLKTSLEAQLDSGQGEIDPGLLAVFDIGLATQAKVTRRFAQRKYPGMTVARRYHAAAGAGKIRIAYLSADFRDHATSYLSAGLFERHDRSRFEIWCVSSGPDDGSAVRSRIATSADRFIDISALSDQEAADLLAASGVHICVDLNGHTRGNRAALLARRPAPIQVAYLGYPGTMAVPFIDYIIGDRFVTPFSEQEFYSERIVQLPDSYQVNDSGRRIAPHHPLRATAGLPDDGLVFCCFNNNYKITRPVFDIWMRLLARVHASVLWLLEGNASSADRLRAAARAQGIDPARLVFARRIGAADHLARHRLADLFLDTLPVNAHTTGSDALWAGLPVVTCTGQSFAGRVGASLLHAANLPELVTGDLGAYEALALKLATDPPRLAEIRDKLARNRLTCPLFDTERLCRHIETAYQTMWTAWVNKQELRNFAVGRA